MGILGTHTNNEWEERDFEYTGDEITDIQLAEEEISYLKRKVKFQVKKFKEISAILDVYSLTGKILKSELQKIKKIVEPYT